MNPSEPARTSEMKSDREPAVDRTDRAVHAQPAIHGDRALTSREVDLINECKAIGTLLDALVNKIRAEPGIDARWAAEAKTDLQKGLMCLVRSVGQPATF